jgi:hypothetical protein
MLGGKTQQRFVRVESVAHVQGYGCELMRFVTRIVQDEPLFSTRTVPELTLET